MAELAAKFAGAATTGVNGKRRLGDGSFLAADHCRRPVAYGLDGFPLRADLLELLSVEIG